eukprot:TRINITY_DN3426_c0_g1_i4.p1 TRINITY_DN3426_c0_g1~~TRINITY_DN3426_c0_g1_i4.p1  ORF type:complete len:431 (+),score=43.25 TRINITY_DN3426_c0_g1_i4:61-1293(+)
MGPNFYPTDENQYYYLSQMRRNQDSHSGQSLLLQHHTQPMPHNNNNLSRPPYTSPYNPPSALPHTQLQNMTQNQRAVMTYFMKESLRAELHKHTTLSLQGTNPDDPISKTLPAFIHTYHSIWPLEPNKDTVSKVFNLPTTVYKTINGCDGLPCILRKINNFNLNTNTVQTIEKWKQFRHPGVVSFKEAFLSKQFENVNCLFFVYDYYPGAETLEQKYLDNEDNRLLPEDVLWTFIVQLCAALKAIHAQGLICQMILPSKIIETGKNRIKINCVGINDALNPDIPNHNPHEDLLHLGKLIIALACKSKNAVNNLSVSLERIGRTYSAHLKDLILALLGKNMTSPPTIDDIWKMLGSRLQVHIDCLFGYTDLLEAELSKELENGRLFRLLAKLGFINERPEYEIFKMEIVEI